MKKASLFLFWLFLAIPCAAEIIIVDADGTGDYPTIQAAIYAAYDGDIIELQPGTYTGYGNRDIDFLGKAITVHSTDPNDPNIVAGTVIDCQSSGRGFYFHSSEGPNSVLEGLTIKSGLSNEGGGIYCIGIYCSCSPTIRSCIIRGNSAERGGGMYNNGCSVLSNCIFSDNSAGLGGGFFNYNKNPTLTNCIFYNNSAQSDGGGILNYLSTLSPKLTNCILYANIDPGGMDESAQIYFGSPDINYCCIQGWTGGLGGVGNIGADPCFVDPCSGDYHLLPNSLCIDSGDPVFVLQQGEVDIDGEPRVMGDCVDMGVDEFDFFEMPFIIISHSTFQFRANKGGPNPEEQILSICNSGLGTLNWEIVEDCNWLAVEPNNGSSTGETNDVILTIGVTGLEEGTYYCNFAIVDPCAYNSPQTVPVTLYVGEPLIELSYNEFEFSAPVEGPNPDPQVLAISNSGGGTLTWEITYDCNWLTVEPNSGSSTGEANEVTLSVDTTGLTESYYHCELTVSDPSAENSPQTVEVTLYTYIGCFDPNHRDYSEWVSVGKPVSWCYKYQCYGDADGMRNGNPFTGYSRVRVEDLNILISGWKVEGYVDPATHPWIAADFDRDLNGNVFIGYSRVRVEDLGILVSHWKDDYGMDNPDCGGDIDLSNP